MRALTTLIAAGRVCLLAASRGTLIAAGRGALIAAAIVLLTACGPAPEQAAAPALLRAGTGDTPVIIYLIDTLRADRLSVYGYTAAKTPAFDALATESVLFEKAYAAAPWTLPSLTSMLTSTYACEHGVVESKRRLGPKLDTLPERMKARGYKTAAFFNNFFAGAVAGLDRGYDLAQMRPDTADDPTPEVFPWLDTVGTDKFFLYIHTMEPHHPFYTPYEYTKPFGHFDVDKKENYLSLYFLYRTQKFLDSSAGRVPGTTDNSAQMATLQKGLNNLKPMISTLYDASVHYADHNLGRLVADLKRRGLWDKSLFIVLADHGEELEEHGTWFHDQSLYEELLHVPLLIKFPGGANAGTRITDRVSLVDLRPTMLDFLGDADGCQQCRGSSLLPLLAGKPLSRTIATDAPGVRLNEAGYYKLEKDARGDVNVALRAGSLKGIWNEGPESVEVYDLARDPGEQANLAAGDPEKAQELRDEAISWLEQCRASAAGVIEVKELDERSKQQMRAIGYFN